MDREKLLTLLKGIDPRYLWVLYLVLVLAFGMALSSIVLYPQERKILEMEDQLKSEQQKVSAVEGFILSNPNIEQYLQEMQRNQAKTEMLLPGGLDVSKFISQLEKDARTSGLRLINVKPAASADKSGYREMPVELSVEGSYFSIVSFMKKLEDGERFSVPTAFLIQPKQTVLAARINLQIFAYGNPPRAAAPPAPGPQAPGPQAAPPAQ